MVAKTAVIIGGSIGGLLAANLLSRRGWDVAVHERIDAELSSRGAGIVTHPELFDVLDACGVDGTSVNVGVTVENRRIIGPDGKIVAERALPQVLTSWGRLYRILKDALPSDRYHQGRNLDHVERDEKGIHAVFDDGKTVRGDLLIGADGIFSTVRRQYLPASVPEYVGYIAWRGLVDENILSQDCRDTICDNFSFSLPTGEQMLGYPVAGADESVERGKRRFNFVWYRPAAQGAALQSLLTDVDGVTHALSIPPHKIRPSIISEMRSDARRLLSPQFAEVVEKTEQPFIQAIQDLETPRMAIDGAIALIGDAAFVARPHVGMGITKAAGDALALVEALSSSEDIATSLLRFEEKRLAFGRAVICRARALGAYMQAQLLTDAERQMAERHRQPEAILAETAVASGIAA